MKIRGFGGTRSKFGRMRFAMKATSALELLGETGGGGGEQQQQEPPAGEQQQQQAAWYDGSITSDEDKAWLANKAYADLPSTIAAHRELERKVGAGRFNVPADWTNAEQATATYKALGRPDELGDHYKLELPEGADATFSTTFAAKAHEVGLLPHQFKALGGFYLEQEAAAAQAAATAAKEAMQSDIAALRGGGEGGWGADFDKNDAIAGAAAKAFNLNLPQLAQAMGAKAALTFLYDLGKKTGEDGIDGGGARPLAGQMSGAAAAEAKKTFLADADKTAKLRAGDPATKAEWASINASIAAEMDRAQAA